VQWIQAPSYTSYILPTIAKKHAFAGFINVTSESNKEVFSPFDTAALRALRELRQDPVSVAAVCVVNPTPIELPTISAPPTSLSTERHPPDWSYYGKTSVELPPLGVDSEFDALFESAVAVTVGDLLSFNDDLWGASLVAPSAHAAAVSLPTGNDTDCAGAPPRFTVTTADIVAEQRTEPLSNEPMAASLLEGVSLLVAAHQYGHTQYSVRLPPPVDPLSEPGLSLHHGLNEALYTSDCDGDENNRPYYGDPPTPFDKKDYVLGMAQDMFPAQPLQTQPPLLVQAQAVSRSPD
jgi:hypothetical protein